MVTAQKLVLGFGLLTFALALGFGVYLGAHGRGQDFAQFLLDRREAAGQSIVDKNATCRYSVIDDRHVSVERRSHGQLTTTPLELRDTLSEPFFARQNALFETASTADTYNCIAAELSSHPVPGDAGNPLARVLFGSSGRNVAVVLQRNGKPAGIEVYTYRVDPGTSLWNNGWDGLRGSLSYTRLVGESLLVSVQTKNGQELHTYNFRAAKRADPWNTGGTDHAPLTLAKLNGEPVFVERGKRVQVNDPTATYEYDFTCNTTDRPCGWKKL